MLMMINKNFITVNKKDFIWVSVKLNLLTRLNLWDFVTLILITSK